MDVLQFILDALLYCYDRQVLVTTLQRFQSTSPRQHKHTCLHMVLELHAAIQQKATLAVAIFRSRQQCVHSLLLIQL